ncbi:MAG: amino acid adenylation domain-containing protein [Chloroflexi bacterium]|nr:amino acid adenylation domain-containing protein [Chloroflexota bacterium]
MAMQNVEDIYPLSPMQQGMVFHSLYAPQSGVYVEQLSCLLRGHLDVPAFERAWQRVIERHAILRTAFAGESLKEPAQVVHRHVQLPLERQDWRQLDALERADQLQTLLETERRRGFLLSKAPLMRQILAQVTDDTFQFVWTYHHALLDGWSVPVLLQEVFAFYGAFRQGHDRRLEPPRPYRDYIVWLKQQDLSKAEAFWRQTLQGFAAPTSLCIDRPAHNTGGETTYTELAIRLPSTMTAALQSLARQNRLTLNTIVQGAWALLLSRYSGEEDVLFGATVSGRPAHLPGAESMVGLFINTLPVRVRVAPDAHLLAWLKQLQAQQLELRQYEYTPLVQIQEWSDVARGVPLFENILVFENLPVENVPLGEDGDLTVQDVQSVEQTNYPMTVVAGPGRELLLKIIFDIQRYDTTAISRLLEHWRTLLEQMLAQHDPVLSALSLLTESERQQMLVGWNETNVDIPRDRCVSQLVADQVERTPDALAVVCGKQRLTYRELNRRANQLSRYLQKHGVTAETPVGLCVERSMDLVVGALGALKAGGAYVPLDPAYPMERLAFMLQDCGMPVLLTQQHLRAQFPATPAHVICLDTDWPLINQEDQSDPGNSTNAGHLAYVIYTSGSTGRPKGVAIEHAGLLNLVFWHRRTFAVSPCDRATQIAGPGFDAAVWELWPYLTAGACIYIPDDETRATPQRLRDWLLAHAITICFVPTPVAEGLLSLVWPPETLSVTCSRGGDQLHRSPAPGLPFTLINNYGPTEDTVVTTSGGVPPRHQGDPAPTIGRPIANTQVYVLDHDMQPVPIGVPGELHIGGAGLARGYLYQPKLTAEKFVPNPFSAAPGTRLYKTGDLVRYRPDGEIEFLGRLDNQVKIRGFRIELGEVEAVLGQHSAVREAVVTAPENDHGDKYLVAYIVPTQPDDAPVISELRAFLKPKLPEYMLPSMFVSLEALPLTPNGKVDRRALPEPNREMEENEYVAPRTPTEEILAGIWAEVLGVERVGTTDDFFELGGHSLLATQIISRVRKAFQAEVPLRDLFETATVAGLAQRVGMARQAAIGLDTAPITPAPRDRPLSLSYAQQRLWFLDQLEPNSPVYNIPTATRLSGTLDQDALEHSLNEIVQRHENLRTTFVAIEGKPAQVIAPCLTLPLPVMDLMALPQAKQEIEVGRLAAEEAKRPFDLAHGPLIRATLLRLDDHEHIILLTMHHIVSDGWSIGVFIQELAALYAAAVAGSPSPLPPLVIQYADFAHWQRQHLQGQHLESELAYWKQQLSELSTVLELPTDRPRPPIQGFEGSTLPFTLPTDLVLALKTLSRREGVTLFMTLLAAFQTLLSRYTGQDDISVGTPIANRNRAEVEGLIGFFVNTLVLRTDLSGNPTFRELLRRVRETALGAYAHQDVPFEMVVDALQPTRDLSHTPLFQVMFVLQNVPVQSLDLPGLTMNPVETDSKIAKFDLTLSMQEDAGEIGGSFEYNTELFDAPTIHRMIGHFQTLLQGILSHPDQSIATQLLLTETERRQLLAEWNAAEAEYPRDRCAHHLFEAQARRVPTAVAAICAETRLTYDELNRRANWLARHLQTLGVKPDMPVGICVERSIEMLIAILGVLKAGGAYVPLDPAYPQERLAFMLQDARMSVVLTQRHLAGNLSLDEAKPIYLDDDWGLISQYSEDNVANQATPEHLAYVIYTSGSTGKPKGVLITHQNLVHSIHARKLYYSAPMERFLLLSSFAFDSSVAGIFGTLCEGGTLILPPHNAERDVLQLAGLIARHRVTHVISLPSFYSLLLAHAQPGQLASLHTTIVAAEACPKDLIEHHYRVLPGTSLYNEYGPTECAVWCSAYPIPPGETRARVPIGRPIANAQIYVLDRHLQLAPVGVPGELHVGGQGLARGYLNRPELTAEKFISNPFSSEPSVRLYKTGDLVRYLPDGNLEFLGRTDEQVKVRGFRIELGEIEAALSECATVRQAAVMAREDMPGVPGNKRLVAYVVPKDAGLWATSQAAQVSNPTLVSELRAALRQKLPEYMVPAAFVVLDALPLMPNGKVNRHALPVPEQSRPELESAYIAPHTSEERTLADIWARVLGVERVGVRDNFFELGGDSILSIQIIAKARQAGLTITPKQFIQNPTIEGLVAAAAAATTLHAEQDIVTGQVPLTPIQRWFFERHPVDPHHWNSSMLIEVWQPLDMALLEQTVMRLLAHHDALRLRFTKSGSEWLQFHAAVDEPLPVSFVDLSSIPPQNQHRAIEQHAAEFQRSFNLSTGPLVRVAYFDLGPEQPARLLMILHHLVFDGVSWRIFLDDFQTIYYQLSHREPAQLSAKTTSFQHWSQRLMAYADSPQTRRELSYWLETGSQQVPAIPVDSADGLNTYGSMDHVTVSLSAEETEVLLHQVPATHGVQINAVLLAALVKAFAHWTGKPTLLFELEGHGREPIFEDTDLSRTIGWFTTSFPVRLTLGNDDDPILALGSIQAQLDRIPNHGIGYGLLRYLCSDQETQRQLAALHQPEVDFNYLGQFDYLPEAHWFPFRIADESFGAEQSPGAIRTVLLNLVAIVTGGELSLRCLYSTNIHQRMTIERLLEDFAAELRAVIRHCDSTGTGTSRQNGQTNEHPGADMRTTSQPVGVSQE